MLDGNNISVVVPGGSTPRYFFELLAKASIDWKKITLVLSDERMVPINHQSSNYGMIRNIFHQGLNGSQHPKILPEMEKFKTGYVDSFLQKTNAMMNNIADVSHAFLGIGADGHTASLFGKIEDLTDKCNSPYFLANNSNETFSRLSLSLAFLQKIPQLTFLVSGNTKQKALESIIYSKNPLFQSSAFFLINNFNGRLKILCDKKACPNTNND
tara:strand:- start:26 stop:664 length:639 start_codon:yes stop_codon:yes gene_type:complete